MATIKGTAAQLDITIEQHSDFVLTLTYTDNNDIAQDLTGYTAKMQIRTDANESRLLLELTETSGLTLGGTAGTIVINITPTINSQFKWQEAKYDLVIDSGTVKTRLVEGKVLNSKGITK